MTDKDVEDIRALEESLWRSETRFDDAQMDVLFADDFCEFGRSGRVYQRDETFFGAHAKEEINATLPLKEFRVRALSDTIVQVMYVSEVRYGDAIERSNRSSIWRRGEGGWQLCFHQGTPMQKLTHIA